MSLEDPQDLLRSGKLTEAREAALQFVKRHPADTQARGLLAQVLLFAGELERADKQFEMVGQQDAASLYAVTAMRRLLKGEMARQSCFTQGSPPEIMGRSNPCLEKHVLAVIALAKGNAPQAQDLLAEAQGERTASGGTCDGLHFSDMRDMDDLLAPVLEVITLGGTYAWVALCEIDWLELNEARAPVDQLWRSTRIAVREGPEGDVFLPCLYPATAQRGDDQLKLGKGSDWLEVEGEPVRGVGHKMFAMDGHDRALFEIRRIEFHH
jgi:type VI secretion system protein ImpE